MDERAKDTPLDRIRALTCDVFGTVVDWRRGVIEAGAELERRTGVAVDWEELADAWRRGYEPAMAAVRSGARPWATIDVLHREILDRLLSERGVALEEAERRWLNAAWHRLPAWPDVHSGLGRLRRRYTTCALSNGNVSLLVDLARYNEMCWDCVLSAELAGDYKPQPVVYSRAAELLDLQPAQVLMVAAHDHDLNGARAVGCATAFLPRPDEWGPGAGAEVPDGTHDIVAGNFNALADALGA